MGTAQRKKAKSMDISGIFSIWSAFDPDLSPEETVLAMERRGIRVCELSFDDGEALLARGSDHAAIGEAFRAYAARHGMTFPQAHLLLSARLCAEGTAEMLRDRLTLYAACGVKNAVLHCDIFSFPDGTPLDVMKRENAMKLRELLPTAEALGIRICLENLRLVFTRVEDLLDVISLAGGSDALGICLDTGHLNIGCPGTHIHFIRAAGPRLHALHIDDNEGGPGDQHLMPFGRGQVDFISLIPVLREIGYTGLFNHEIPGETNLPLPLRDAKAAYLRRVTEYLWNGQ